MATVVRPPAPDDTREDGGDDYAAVRTLVPSRTPLDTADLNDLYHQPDNVALLDKNRHATVLLVIRRDIQRVGIAWWAWDGVDNVAAEDVMLEAMLETVRRGAARAWLVRGVFQNQERTKRQRTNASRRTARAVRDRWWPSLFIYKDPDSDYWVADTTVEDCIVSMQAAVAARGP